MLQEMMAAYNRGIEIDPSLTEDVQNQLRLAYYNEFQRGIQAFNRGQQATNEDRTEFSNAASHFGNAAVIFPDSIGAYVNQAYAFFSAGEAEKAIEPFETAVEKGDESEDTFIYLADLYRTYDQPDKGIELLERARELYPGNENIQAQLMNFYVSSGREDEAMQVYKDAVASEPSNKLYRYNYGSLLLEIEDYDGAIEQLTRAVEIDPNYGNAYYNLGAAYVNKAVSINEEVTTLDDDLRERRSEMSDDDIAQVEAQMEELADTRRGLFESAVTPLEKAKELAEAENVDGTSLQGICQALFQSYVQTNQMDKAESVSECANVDLN
jgi:tetratricopeptide (TPR) repeat protein